MSSTSSCDNIVMNNQICLQIQKLVVLHTNTYAFCLFLVFAMVFWEYDVTSNWLLSFPGTFEHHGTFKTFIAVLRWLHEEFPRLWYFIEYRWEMFAVMLYSTLRHFSQVIQKLRVHIFYRDIEIKIDMKK